MPMAPSILTQIVVEVRAQRGDAPAFEVRVSAKNDSSRRFALQRTFDEFEKLHVKLGKPKKLLFPKKSAAQPELMQGYLRKVIQFLTAGSQADPALTAGSEAARCFLDLAVRLRLEPSTAWILCHARLHHPS